MIESVDVVAAAAAGHDDDDVVTLALVALLMMIPLISVWQKSSLTDERLSLSLLLL